MHQIGQLFAVLLSGVGSRKVTAQQVKKFPCSAHTKSVLQRCIGVRRKCFASASEMLEALEARDPVPATPARVRSLDGKRVVFTGGLSLPRANALESFDSWAFAAKKGESFTFELRARSLG